MENTNFNEINKEEVAEIDVDIEEVAEIDVDIEQIGPRGLSAYEVYLQNGGTLNEEEWLKTLIGPTGASGVYIGNTEPGDIEVKVWIDTSDETIILNAEGESF